MTRGAYITRPSTARRMDALAQVMADGCPTLGEAAGRLGLDRTTVGRLWKRIREGLGEQAR